jgi:hypothetical protein
MKKQKTKDFSQIAKETVDILTGEKPKPEGPIAIVIYKKRKKRTR